MYRGRKGPNRSHDKNVRWAASSESWTCRIPDTQAFWSSPSPILILPFTCPFRWRYTPHSKIFHPVALSTKRNRPDGSWYCRSRNKALDFYRRFQCRNIFCSRFRTGISIFRDECVWPWTTPQRWSPLSSPPTMPLTTFVQFCRNGRAWSRPKLQSSSTISSTPRFPEGPPSSPRPVFPCELACLSNSEHYSCWYSPTQPTRVRSPAPTAPHACRPQHHGRAFFWCAADRPPRRLRPTTDFANQQKNGTPSSDTERTINGGRPRPSFQKMLAESSIPWTRKRPTSIVPRHPASPPSEKGPAAKRHCRWRDYPPLFPPKKMCPAQAQGTSVTATPQKLSFPSAFSTPAGEAAWKNGNPPSPTTQRRDSL